VRSLPRSRCNPQFNSETLQVSLAAQGIAYHHFPGLGGFRRSKENTGASAQKDSHFGGYRAYMRTEEFRNSLEDLIDISRKGATVFMCAEADPARCHRSLIADALEASGREVFHILGMEHYQRHTCPEGERSSGQTPSAEEERKAEQLTFDFPGD
jgi:uncharacterized protein (DUF488 family)